MRTRFTYVRAASVDDAVRLQSSSGTARYLAGGTDLYLDWKNGAPLQGCVDISGLTELDYLRAEGDVLHIGALTTLRTLEHGGGTDPVSRTLARLAAVMCTPQTRTLATVGGNLCNASAAADLTPLLLCLDAQVSVVGHRGPRTLPLVELASSPKRTTLAANELVTEVAVRLQPRTAAWVHRATRTALDIALVHVAVVIGTDDAGVITRARVGLGSVGPVAFTVPEVQAALVGQPVDDMEPGVLAAVAAAAARSAQPIDDPRASAVFRTQQTATLTRRALADAVADLREQSGTR